MRGELVLGGLLGEREHLLMNAGNGPVITSRLVRRGSPDPAVVRTEGLLASGDWRPSVGRVARSGDLATTATIQGSYYRPVPSVMPCPVVGDERSIIVTEARMSPRG